VIDVHKNGGTWTVTLNRPDKANALTIGMLEHLAEVFAQAQQDTDLRVLVVTGAGTRVFCAGADLGEARDASSITTNPVWEQMSSRLANLPCLTIAALNGTLVGGGFALALACDLRLAVPGANFFYPVLKNGFLPQPSDVARMTALIGPSRTRLILLAAQKLDAQTALAYGLIDRILLSEDFAATIADLSAAALTAEGHTLTAIKRLGEPGLTAEMQSDCFHAVYHDDKTARLRIRQGSRK
jgi:enoyl-CoA hydratase/carnithine racemase